MKLGPLVVVLFRVAVRMPTGVVSRSSYPFLCGYLSDYWCPMAEEFFGKPCEVVDGVCVDADPLIQSQGPSQGPSSLPSSEPSTLPSARPTSSEPSLQPSLDEWNLMDMPSQTPSVEPSSLPSQSPSDAPSQHPSQSPSTAITYVPGNLTVTATDRNGKPVLLSTGLTGHAVAYSGYPVEFTGGGQSAINFHSSPDGAMIFPNAATGGFYYSSNSEVKRQGGGVGVLEFDANGEVVDYYRTLTGTSWNCGGGPTPWGSWVSCEENGANGRVWQTDPTGVIPSRRTEVVDTGGNYESFAYDVRAPENPHFFTTNDSGTGPLVRYTPGNPGKACFLEANPADRWCTLEDTVEDGATYEFLRVDEGDSGSFSWESNKENANPVLYPHAEGIDVVGNILIFVSKADRTLFELDLDAGTFTRSSTQSGAFNRQPDQLEILVHGDVGSDGIDEEDFICYFCEDGGSDCGVHASDATGQYFTILDGIGYNTETTGLAFSPDAKYMLVSFQHNPGVIWQIWREDGLPFTGQRLDIKYHEANHRRRRLSEARVRLGAPLRRP